MCGLTGVYGWGESREAVARASCAIEHRGPDHHDTTDLRDGAGRPVGAFAHRRLAIIDLSNASDQPMLSGDGRWTLVFNGEIYNYRELRSKLLAEGVVFKSDGDTEVLLEGFRRHGAAFLARLRGMFAFAAWDAASSRGWVARDPFGIKPLYLCCTGERVAFASELRALLAGGWSARVIDREAVASFLTFGSVTEPRTMLRDVSMLPAGTLAEIVVDERGARMSAPVPFAEPLLEPPSELIADPAAAAALVRGALRESVQYHMVSDVPVGLFLSGGLDSSAVVALASEIAEGPVSTFTVGFDERAFDESAVARIVARRFGTDHHEVKLDGDQLLAMLPDAIAATDQPSLDGINTYVVSKAVRERGLKVVLSGLGGDEMFAGYPSFQRARAIAPWWGATSLLRTPASRLLRRAGGMRVAKLGMMLGAGSPADGAYLASRLLLGDRSLHELVGGETVPLSHRAPASLPLLQQVSWHELSGYMRNTLLRDSDVYSMRHALELRVPLVDRGVAQATASIADSLKLKPGVSKPLLVSALADLLPREVWDRPKQGFTFPFAVWMRDALRPTIEAELRGPGVAAAGLEPGAVTGVFRDFLAGKIGWSRPWALFMLARWAREHVVEDRDRVSAPARERIVRGPVAAA